MEIIKLKLDKFLRHDEMVSIVCSFIGKCQFEEVLKKQPILQPKFFNISTILVYYNVTT